MNKETNSILPPKAEQWVSRSGSGNVEVVSQELATAMALKELYADYMTD